jgi:hypothetical protein
MPSMPSSTGGDKPVSWESGAGLVVLVANLLDPYVTL